MNNNVDYTKIDPLKKLAQSLAKTTSQNSDLKVMEESYGESAFVWEEDDCFRAFVIEGLGTKSLVADEVRKFSGKTHYDALAQDTIAMIVNDLIVVGAKPQIINAYFAAGSSDWFADEQRSKDLLEGFAKACIEAGTVWGGGESPALGGIINETSSDLAGSAIGIIKPKERLTLGDKLTAGDAILLIESSGIHANGLSKARTLAEGLKEKYQTKLPDGSTFGETLLTPTHIYSSTIQNLSEEGIDVHYLVNITGHGFRKLMRANQQFSYRILNTPPLLPIFEFIQQESGMSDEEMYATFNMGAGFAVFLPKDQLQKAQVITAKHNLKSWNAGVVEQGEKQVIIENKNITFKAESLGVR